MRKKSPPKSPETTETRTTAEAEAVGPEQWSSAFESPDDLWMHLLARAEQEGEEERDELGGWLTSEGISMIAAREWELLRESRPTLRD